MFIMSGVSHYLISSQSDFYSTNHSFPIDRISNNSDEPIRQKLIDLNIKQASVDAGEAHDLAYFAYSHRRKRTAGVLQYSEVGCQNAYSELTRLVSVVVASPSAWYRYKSRIQELQSIAKSADCKTG